MITHKNRFNQAFEAAMSAFEEQVLSGAFNSLSSAISQEISYSADNVKAIMAEFDALTQLVGFYTRGK